MAPGIRWKDELGRKTIGTIIKKDTLDSEPQIPTTAGLSIQTKGLHISTLSEPPPTAHPEQPPLPPVSTVLRPTHLKMPHFGSRFPPHSTTPIRCLLPLQADRLLLIGHDEGFSVLEMYPQDWNDSGGIDLKGPEDAAVRLIWEGESVFQMLELNHTSGVVLMLVGPEPDSPLARGLKSLVPTAASRSSGAPESSSSYQPPLTPQSSLNGGGSGAAAVACCARAPAAAHKLGREQLVDGRRPVATVGAGLVPLASAESRLVNASVLSFALAEHEENRELERQNSKALEPSSKAQAYTSHSLLGMVRLGSSGAFRVYERTILLRMGIGFGVEVIENTFIRVN
ncbi:hypothetical protein B0H14DRAFT_3599178 [Mycena olivaceomarginata]|nr:hypothetical protein B0H14DRAFT_3599178 [Mycena olivaceomarginata]